TYFTPDKAVKAFMHHVNHERSQRLLKETPTTHTDHMVDRERARDIIRTACARKRSYLSHGEARELVQCYGIPTLNTRYCDDEDEVVEAHRSLGRPVNLTVLHQASCSPFMEEASGRGRYHGTVRWLNEEEALRRSCQVLLEQYRRHYPHSGFLGFAVQEAFPSLGGVAFSVGITRDPVFGPLVVCGSGGAAINVIEDRKVALPPLNMALAHDLLRQTFMYKVLQEFSYHPDQDIRKICEVLVALSLIVIDNPEIHGLEILPLMFTAQGVVAVEVAADLAAPARLSIQPRSEERRVGK